MESQLKTTQTVSALKLPVLKTGDYDLWSMRMEQYLTHTDYALWEVIMNGDAPAIATASTEGPIPPKTTEQKLARKNKLKAKSTLLLAIPDEHLLKFHGIKDTKSLWEAIKTRFGGNKESKKMQKTILKREVISQEDANLKLLRSLPSAWNNIALIMRNKDDLDDSNSWNVAFVSSDDTSSTNEAVNTAHDVPAASSKRQASSLTYADDVMFSFFVNQSNSPQLDNEDLEQIDTDECLVLTVFFSLRLNNRVLVTKSHNKTPYELLLGRPPSIRFMRPFRCPVTILNILDPLGKFDGKADEGFLVGYSINSKDFRVFNTRIRKVEENPHINFLENKSNVTGSGPEWLFDIDSLTKSMNYEPVTAGNQTNGNVGIETNVNAGQAGQEKASYHEYILLPLMLSNSPLSSSTQSTDDKDADEVPDKGDDDVSQRNGQEKEGGASNKEDDQHVQDFIAELDSLLVQQKEGYANSTNRDSTASPSVSTARLSINTASENVNTGSPNINTASPIPNDSSMQSLENTGIFNDAYNDREVGAEADLNNFETTMNVSPIPTTRIHNYHPKDQIIGDINSATQTRGMTKIFEAHVMVWTLVDLPKGKRAIGTKWVYKNKKDEREIVVRNKARLVAQGYTQEEDIDYDEVFAPVARIGAIRFRRGTIDKTLFIKKDKDDAQEVLDEFYRGAHFLLRVATSTLIETNKALNKDEEAEDVDVHLYRSMIGSLVYLTASRPDIMFVVCACARFQVTPKTSHLHVVKRIFRYLKGQPKLGLWYPRDSPFDKPFLIVTMLELALIRNPQQEVLWIQNQMLDYGFNFMNTKIHIDNESTIFIVKNLMFHSKTKHIEIRHHFIRDSYEKKLVQVIKIHTNHTVADLLIKAFDVNRKAKRTTKISQSSRPIHLVADETVYKEWEDRMERAATTASSLEAEHDSGSGPRCQDTILGGAEAQIRFEAAFKKFNDLPLSRVNTLGSGEDIMKLMELMELCTKLSARILENKNRKSDLFAETHNLVAFLEKPEESSEFKEIIDFLNASYVQYALTVNPIIYTTCIEQFWTSVKLDDAEGIDCLPTALIFPELERMGAKTTSWNKFSSTMASTIICLATNQTFNFSKYIFDNLVKHLEGEVKFLMYPRFVQVFLDKQVEGMARHKGVYVTPSHTKKVFANMKRPCKGFSGRVTPLFSIMMVQATKNIENVLNLEKAKTTQAKEISSLTKRVKKLEKRRKLKTPGLKRLRKISSTSRVESSNDTQEMNDDNLMFDTVTSANVEVTTVNAPTTTIDELTLAQTLIEIKACKPKAITFAATTTTTTRPKARGVAKDKGKGIMVKPEVPLKKKDQILFSIADGAERKNNDIALAVDEDVVSEPQVDEVDVNDA
ncbi:putative ribonuclease H-like domain-containing protein [Tanacetum coccineum]